MANAVIHRFGGEVHYTYQNALQGFSATLSPIALDALEKDPRIAFIEPDRVVHIFDEQSPAVWGLDRGSAHLPLTTPTPTAPPAPRPRLYCRYRHPLTHEEFAGVSAKYLLIEDNEARRTATDTAPTWQALSAGDHGLAKDVTLYPVRVSIARVPARMRRHRRRRLDQHNYEGPGRRQFEPAQRLAKPIRRCNAIEAGDLSSPQATPTLTPAIRPLSRVRPSPSALLTYKTRISNKGACVDIFAPGAEITSAGHRADDAVATLSGTLMAAPHVAGGGALPEQNTRSAGTGNGALLANASADYVTDAGAGSPNALLYARFAQEESTPAPTEQLTEEPTDEPTEEPAETPAETPTDANRDARRAICRRTGEEPVEEPAQTPAGLRRYGGPRISCRTEVLPAAARRSRGTEPG